MGIRGENVGSEGTAVRRSTKGNRVHQGSRSRWEFIVTELCYQTSSHVVAQPQVQQRGAVGFTRGLAGMFTERVMKGQRGKGFGE